MSIVIGLFGKLAIFFVILAFMVAAAVVSVIIGSILRAVMVVLQAIGKLCVAGAVGTVVGLCGALLGLEPEYAWLIGVSFTVLAATLIFKRGRSGHSLGIGTDKQWLSKSAINDPEVYKGATEPPSETRVSKAWEQLAEMVPIADVQALNCARNTCAKLLIAFEAQPYAFELMDTVVLIRRNIPELAHRNALLWRDAGEIERAKLSAGIMEDIALLEKHASDKVLELHRSRQGDLQAIRNHIAARTEEKI